MALIKVVVSEAFQIKNGDRVALSEAHPDHPDGRAFVAGRHRNKLDKDGRVVLDNNGEPKRELNVREVEETPAVLRKLSDATLVVVRPKAKQSASPAGNE